MRIILHAGLHFTDEDRLLKSLLRNRERLQPEGTIVPGPSRYRRLLRDTLQGMAQGSLTADARQILLDAILDEDPPDRLILSNDNFFCVPKLAIGDGRFYPRAETKLAQFCEIFAPDTVELFIALRNPATLLPALQRGTPPGTVETALAGNDPMALQWAEMITRLREAVPGVAITVWCNEDTPLIWGQLIREMAGLDMTDQIVGGYDLLSEIMAPAGMKRFRDYLSQHPQLTEIQRRRVIAAFLDKFALDEEIEEIVDLPGWTDDLVEDLTEVYDEDVFHVSRLPGVTFVAP